MSPVAARERIVLIGGEENAIQGLAQLLSLEGFRVDAFREIGRACESLSVGRPGAVIADIDPPGPFGMEYAEMISRVAPFILVTSRADDVSSHKAWEMGASAILEKPLKFEDLMSILRGSSPAGIRDGSALVMAEAEHDGACGLLSSDEVAHGRGQEDEVSMPLLSGSRAGDHAGKE